MDYDREHTPDHMFDHRRRDVIMDERGSSRPRRPPQTPPEPSPEGDMTPLGQHSPITPTYPSGGRHRGPRTPEGPSPPPMDRNNRLREDSPPQSTFMRGRGIPRTPEGSPQGSYDPEDALTSPPRHSRDRMSQHGKIWIKV